MLYNLKAEFIRKNINPTVGVQQALGCSEKTARNKIYERTETKVTEGVKIKNMFFPGLSIEYLFASDKRRT